MKDATIIWDGKTITKPGMYSGVPLELYHAPNICDGPSASSSMLRALNPDLGSPAHFYAKWPGNPNHIETPDADHFKVGRALHHLVLGEKFFAKLFIMQPEELPHYKTGELRKWHGNNIECREWLKNNEKSGRAPLDAKMIEQLKQMSISVGNHPLVRGTIVKGVRHGILDGMIERSFFWKDKETGIWLKWRPDSVPTDAADFCDLKTTISVHWPALARVLRERAYYQQGALGRWACWEVLHVEMSSFTNLFVEKSAPWCTRDVRIDQQDLHRGERMNRACLRIFAKCLKDNHWPGPGEGNEGNERLGLSPAAREQIDERLKMEGLRDGED